jgi:hypothetical protein
MKIKHGLFLSLLAFIPLGLSAAGPDSNGGIPEEVLPFAKATEKAFDRTGKYQTHQTHADGSSSTEHNGSLQNVTVARIGPNGKIETYCTTEQSSAIAFMTNTGTIKGEKKPALLFKEK